MLTENQIIAGLGLVIVLAIGSRLLAQRFRVPAIVLLLPVGFLAGAITDDVKPEALFGDTFQPIVSLGVGLILFEAGLRLRFSELGSGVRHAVLRLITVGALLTLACVTVASRLIFDLGWGVSAMLGAILVVSGPTVVLPLLSFVRPTDRVRSVLKWEGTLIDPIGALLGVLALDAITHGVAGERPFHPGLLVSSLGIGIAVGAAAAGALWLLLGSLERSSPAQAAAAALMAVTAAIAGADLLRADAGLVAAAAMGMIIAQQRRLDVSKILEFHGTVVELLIGVLFVLISASVTPAQVDAVLGKGLILVAVMVFLVRPLVVALGAWGSDLDLRERAFAAWMAPRGIVAAATASAFSLSLARLEVSGAEQILPIAFVVIFATVVLYGLTAVPVARLLGVAGTGSPLFLVVGGNPAARAVAAALQEAGARVRLWTSSRAEREEAATAGLEAGSAPLGVDVESLESELEEVTDALVMSSSDDFNALAAFELRRQLGRECVYRLTPREDAAVEVPARAEGLTLFTAELTFPELSRRLEAGARIAAATGDGSEAPGAGTPLFVQGAEGELRVVSAGDPPRVGPDESLISLGAG